MRGDPDNFLDSVETHIRAAIEHCGDRWGRNTGLLADGFSLRDGEPLRWEEAIVSDLSCQQNLLRALDGLAAVRGEDEWRDVAGEWIGSALTRLADAESGLLYWGGHSAWDLATDQPLRGNHELKCAYPFYDFLYRTDAAAVSGFVEALWHAHIWSWSSLLFNRHGEYEPWDRGTRWREGEFAGSQVPIIDNKALSFINTGSDLIYAASELYRLTGERAPYRWALDLLSCYESIRSPDTGLAGYQFNHGDPCRVRESFKGDLGRDPRVNETTVIGNYVIDIRYGRVAVTFLNIVEAFAHTGGLTADEAAPLVELTTRDLRALAAHSWSDEQGYFQPVLNDGTRLTPEHTDDVGYCQPVKLRPVRPNGLLFLAYARAFRQTGEEEFRSMALRLGEVMGWGRLDDSAVDFGALDSITSSTADGRAHGGQYEVCVLEGVLDLYQATGDDNLLESATSMGQCLIDRQLVDGLFAAARQGPNGAIGIDSSAPVSLIRLAAAIAGSDAEIPAFYPNFSQFDPKVIIARR